MVTSKLSPYLAVVVSERGCRIDRCGGRRRSKQSEEHEQNGMHHP